MTKPKTAKAIAKSKPKMRPVVIKPVEITLDLYSDEVKIIQVWVVWSSEDDRGNLRYDEHLAVCATPAIADAYAKHLGRPASYISSEYVLELSIEDEKTGREQRTESFLLSPSSNKKAVSVASAAPKSFDELKKEALGMLTPEHIDALKRLGIG